MAFAGLWLLFSREQNRILVTKNPQTNNRTGSAIPVRWGVLKSQVLTQVSQPPVVVRRGEGVEPDLTPPREGQHAPVWGLWPGCHPSCSFRSPPTSSLSQRCCSPYKPYLAQQKPQRRSVPQLYSGQVNRSSTSGGGSGEKHPKAWQCWGTLSGSVLRVFSSYGERGSKCTSTFFAGKTRNHKPFGGTGFLGGKWRRKAGDQEAG